MESLRISLLFLKMEELRNICDKLHIINKGKKGAVIARIIHFLQTKEVIAEPKIPAISIAKKGESYPLKKDTLILKGSYKNDLKTRMFLKELVGEYFHFTAFGVDWIDERWLAKNPPTYGEFAEMWKYEYNIRKKIGSTPKDEWAYINYTKQYVLQNPNATRKQIIQNWEKERMNHFNNVNSKLKDILQEFSK